MSKGKNRAEDRRRQRRALKGNMDLTQIGSRRAAKHFYGAGISAKSIRPKNKDDRDYSFDVV